MFACQQGEVMMVFILNLQVVAMISGWTACLYRTLTQAEGIWDYPIKDIGSGNCRFVQTLVG
jgi:hypothetical protein